MRVFLQTLIAVFFFGGLVAWVADEITTEKMDWIMSYSLLLQILLEIKVMKK